jgi:hypothetical protein
MNGSTGDNMDRGAILMYSNGANQKFGTKVKIVGGVVTATVSQIDADHLDNNKMGADDYVLAVVYTYTNGYGETAAITEGFSNDQVFLTGNGGNVNNAITPGGTGGTLQLPAENPTGDLQNYYDNGGWSSIKALANARLTKDDYKNKYGIEPGDTIISNGTIYVLVDLGLDNNSDGIIDEEEQKGYDGFVFMYDSRTSMHMNPSTAAYTYGHNNGGYVNSEMKLYVDDGDDTNNVDLYDKLDPSLKPFLKKVTITCNSGNRNKNGIDDNGMSVYTHNCHLFLSSAKEVGFNTSGWSSNRYDAEGTCFDLFTTDDSSRTGFMSTAHMSSSVWWLRSAGSYSYNSFSVVNTNGLYDAYRAKMSSVVVPAFVIG